MIAKKLTPNKKHEITVIYEKDNNKFKIHVIREIKCVDVEVISSYTTILFIKENRELTRIEIPKIIDAPQIEKTVKKHWKEYFNDITPEKFLL